MWKEILQGTLKSFPLLARSFDQFGHFESLHETKAPQNCCERTDLARLNSAPVGGVFA